jgi:integrase
VIFGLLAVVDINGKTVPLNDFPFGIAERFTHHMAPTIFAIPTPQPMDGVERLIDSTIGDKRIRESTETTRKAIAAQYERTRRLEVERALAGLPTEAPQKRINTVGDLVKKYLDQYPINRRTKSIIFANQRLAHVRRLLGKWSLIWPNVRKLEEGSDVGRALSIEEESRLLTAAARDDSPNCNPAMYPFLCIALSTGMRSGEIATLRWFNVDLDNSLLTVGRAKTKGNATSDSDQRRSRFNPRRTRELVSPEGRSDRAGTVCLSWARGQAKKGRAEPA